MTVIVLVRGQAAHVVEIAAGEASFHVQWINALQHVIRQQKETGQGGIPADLWWSFISTIHLPACAQRWILWTSKSVKSLAQEKRACRVRTFIFPCRLPTFLPPFSSPRLLACRSWTCFFSAYIVFLLPSPSSHSFVDQAIQPHRQVLVILSFIFPRQRTCFLEHPLLSTRVPRFDI